MDSGLMKGMGDPKRVVGAYVNDVEVSEEHQLAAGDAKAKESTTAVSLDESATDPLPHHPIETAEGPADMFRATEGRWGSREVEIVDVRLIGPDGQPGHIFHSGDPIAVQLRIVAPQPVSDFVFGFGLFSADGVCCYGTNTDLEGVESRNMRGEVEVTLAFNGLDLVEGTYKIDVAVHKRDGVTYDYHRLLHTFRMKSRTKDIGIYRPAHRWIFAAGIDVHDRAAD
jgi:hypothetical protein